MDCELVMCEFTSLDMTVGSDPGTFKCDCRRRCVCVGVATRSSPTRSREELKHETEEQGENAEAETQTHDRRNAVLAEGTSGFWKKKQNLKLF